MTYRWCLDKNTVDSATLKYTICSFTMIHKTKTILSLPSRIHQGSRPPLGKKGEVKKLTAGSNSSRNDLGDTKTGSN